MMQHPRLCDMCTTNKTPSLHYVSGVLGVAMVVGIFYDP